MKAIILAGGEGARLRPFTNTVPKPLIKIFGKPILEHNIINVFPHVDEIIIVVKHKKHMIMEYFGDHYQNVKISYHIQGDDKGTAAAIRGLSLKNDVIIMNGDTIFDRQDLENVIGAPGYAVLVKESETPEKYGVFEIDIHNHIKKIVEKPEKYIGNLINLGVYKFSHEIFDLIEQIKLSKRNEYEITDAINLFAENNELKPIKAQGAFIDVGYPWDILNANTYFLNRLEASDIKGTVEPNVTIKGNIVLEEGAVLKSGTYIEGNVYIGKNASIGPNAYLRGNTVIGEGTRIGNAVEIKNSAVGDYTHISHLSYVGDSIIGNHVNLAAGFKSANLKHNGNHVKVLVKGELINTHREKLGAIIGDNVKTGLDTLTHPGRIIENDTWTRMQEVVK